MSGLTMKYVSLGKSNGLWAVGQTDGTLYRLFGDGGMVGWVPDEETQPEGAWAYTVKAGDTLNTIAATQYSTNDWPRVNRIVAEIVRLNYIPDKNNIAAGLALSMPPLNY